MNIERLTPDSLILTKGRFTLRYAREQSGNTAKASESIPASKIVPAKQMKVMKGRLRIGPEVRSFIPEGSGEAYWIVDATGELYQKYDKTTGGVKTEPLYMQNCRWKTWANPRKVLLRITRVCLRYIK